MEYVEHVPRANFLALKVLLMLQEDTDETCLDVIGRFLILSYDRTSSLSKDDEVRQEHFSRKAGSLYKIPGT